MIVNFNTGAYLRAVPALARAASAATSRSTCSSSTTPRTTAPTGRPWPTHPWARLIENPDNVYLSPAWNQGIRATSAPYVLLLNPDTEWWAGTLADYVAGRRRRTREPASSVRSSATPTARSTRAAGRSRASSTRSGHAFLGSGPTRAIRFTRRYQISTDGTAPREREVDWVSGCCMLIPRGVFDEVGLLDEGFPLFGEELDFATRLRDAGRSCCSRPRSRSCTRSASREGASREMLRCTRRASTVTTESTEPPGGAERRCRRRAPPCGRAPSSRRCEEGSPHDEGRRPGRGGGHAHASAHRDRAQAAAAADGSDAPSTTCSITSRATACTRSCSARRTSSRCSTRSSRRARGDPSITWITETHALGTGGAIVNALEAAGDEPFFALNGDILTDLDLTAMKAFHDAKRCGRHDRAAPRRRRPGVRPRRDRRRRQGPRVPGEARVDPIPGDVNAGTYLLDPAVLRATGRPARPSRSSGRLPGGDRRRPPRRTASRPTRTGSTSARPRSTCRRTSTCSRARCTA